MQPILSSSISVQQYVIPARNKKDFIYLLGDRKLHANRQPTQNIVKICIFNGVAEH